MFNKYEWEEENFTFEKLFISSFPFEKSFSLVKRSFNDEMRKILFVSLKLSNTNRTSPEFHPFHIHFSSCFLHFIWILHIFFPISRLYTVHMMSIFHRRNLFSVCEWSRGSIWIFSFELFQVSSHNVMWNEMWNSSLND